MICYGYYYELLWCNTERNPIVASKAKVPLGKLMNFNDRLDLVLLTGLPTWWWWCWWLAQAPGAPGDVSAFIIGMTTDPQRKWLRSIFAQMISNFVVCVSHPPKKILTTTRPLVSRSPWRYDQPKFRNSALFTNYNWRTEFFFGETKKFVAPKNVQFEFQKNKNKKFQFF